SYGLNPEEWRNVPFYEGPGCIECGGTGYHGRTAIHELLDLSDRIRELILEKRPSSEIRKAAHEEGMKFLRDSALPRVRAGITTMKEINKVTFIETTRYRMASLNQKIPRPRLACEITPEGVIAARASEKSSRLEVFTGRRLNEGVVAP